MHRPTIRRGGIVLLGLVLATTVGTTAAPAVAAAPARHASVLPAKREEMKWYQVRHEYQGAPEFLYEIAARFLGDGERWREIFALNKGRIQPDGGSLTDPTVITPGWYLYLPADAKGDGVQTGPLVVNAPGAAASGAPSAAAAAPAAPASGKESGTTALVLWIVAGVLLLASIVAGVLWFLRRRPVAAAGQPVARKPAARGAAEPAVAAPTRTFDTAAAWTIDRALQVLVTAADAGGRPTPPVYAVSIDESRISLRLAAPDEDPTEPWEALEHGRIWQASLRDLQALPASNDLPSPCPRLVTLGTTGGVRELIDLGQATGMISIQGDKAAARDLVAAWTEELSSSPWAGGVQVVAGDIRPHLTGGERVSIRDALSLAEGDGSDTAYTLRGGSSGGKRTLGVLILGSTPGSRELERAQSLVNRPDAAWVVIVLGQTRYDRWRFTVDADGRLDTGALGLTVYTGSAPARAGR
ncbi:LysM peptidoglycan-binding domain-containing protein [Actinoplanes teichomyceticus]|uniref:LysM domain-containing protein n=1 Tax=Actinoplanes teichomyceticus TaxID=1867 RepID=A0A561WKA7_ACTTI|nr:hypothetical protein [Actinoplanes teichomyceticus]TWG24263.1 hypothetical protein FHX34_102816 [Actinoplanes teichomyceticus]GIF12891.1 hypothetical protein Ate01nite_29230 [Actinoplanes teichomyceticus]